MLACTVLLQHSCKPSHRYDDKDQTFAAFAPSRSASDLPVTSSGTYQSMTLASLKAYES